jgi:hypothetical protein
MIAPPLAVNPSLYPKPAFNPTQFVTVSVMAAHLRQDAGRWRNIIRAAECEGRSDYSIIRIIIFNRCAPILVSVYNIL